MPRLRPALGLSLAVASIAANTALAVPAQAAGTTVTTNRHTVRVSSTTLSAAGQKVVVTGRGFNPRVGIYVSLCVIPPRGQQPTPCGGGVNMSGTDTASVWVSSNPPPYGRGLARPYGKGGSFTVTLTVSAQIADIDCRVTKCAIVTRADHLRSGDRRFDVIVPVRFQ